MSPEVINPTCSILGSLFMLAVLGIAIAVVTGIYKPEEAIKKLLSLVVLLVLVTYFISIATGIWLQMAFWQRGLIVLIGILLAVSAMRGKSRGGDKHRS